MNRATLLKTLAVILTVGASMNANAGPFGFGGTSWKEEVLLHDGTKIVVERSLVRGGRHEIGQRSGATNETLAFNIPGTNRRVVWEDKYSEDIRSSNFNLLMLEVKGDVAYIVATPMGCLSYNKWGRPNPPYVVFGYWSNEWQRIAIDKLPDEFKTPNLVISSPDDAAGKAVHGVVPVEAVQSLNSTASQPEYRAILREPLPNANAGCGEMVPDGKGGWIGMGWFRDQPTYEACVKFCGFKKMGAQYCPCSNLFGGK